MTPMCDFIAPGGWGTDEWMTETDPARRAFFRQTHTHSRYCYRSATHTLTPNHSAHHSRLAHHHAPQPRAPRLRPLRDQRVPPFHLRAIQQAHQPAHPVVAVRGVRVQARLEGCRTRPLAAGAARPGRAAGDMGRQGHRGRVARAAHYGAAGADPRGAQGGQARHQREARGQGRAGGEGAH